VSIPAPYTSHLAVGDGAYVYPTHATSASQKAAQAASVLTPVCHLLLIYVLVLLPPIIGGPRHLPAMLAQ
jgi:hypothetical protein